MFWGECSAQGSYTFPETRITLGQLCVVRVLNGHHSSNELSSVMTLRKSIQGTLLPYEYPSGIH